MKPLLRALPLLALAACGGGPLVAPLRYDPAPPAAEEPFPPRPDATPVLPSVSLPWKVSTLPNGLRLVVLERHALPLVAVQLVYGRGSADVGAPIDTYGILQRMLAEGTGARTPDELSAAYAGLGASHGTFFSEDAWGISCKAASADLDATVALVAEQATRPRFAVDYFSDRRARWQQDFLNTRYQARNMLFRNALAVLFGPTHPYGFTRPDPAHTGALALAQLEELHRRLLHPGHAALVVVGDTTEDAVRASASRWLGGAAPEGEPPPRATLPPALPSREPVTFVLSATAQQVNAAVVARGPAPGDADMAAIEVLARSLGGLSSRLRGEVRVEGGAAYDYSAGVQAMRGGSIISIGGQLDRDKAIPALRAILAGVAEARSLGVREPEVERAKTSLIAAWRSAIGTAGGLAGLAADALERDQPLDAIAAYPARIAAVTREDVRRAAARWLDASAMRVVVVGSADVRKRVAELGLGALDQRDGWGAPLGR